MIHGNETYRQRSILRFSITKRNGFSQEPVIPQTEIRFSVHLQYTDRFDNADQQYHCTVPDKFKNEFKDNAIKTVTKFLGELIYTHPEKVIVFRDNNVSDIGHILIDKCLAQNIPVISYNSLGHITPVNSANTDNPQKYYRVRHPNNVAIGETEELPR